MSHEPDGFICQFATEKTQYTLWKNHQGIVHMRVQDNSDKNNPIDKEMIGDENLKHSIFALIRLIAFDFDISDRELSQLATRWDLESIK